MTQSDQSDTVPLDPRFVLSNRGWATVTTLGELRRALEPFDDELRIFVGDPSDHTEPPLMLTLVRVTVGGRDPETKLCIGESGP